MSNEEAVTAALDRAVDLTEQAIAVLAGQNEKLPPGKQRDTVEALIRVLSAKVQKALVALAIASWQSPKVQDALDALNKIAKENEDIAGKMKKTTDWLDSAAEILTQAKKAVEAVEKIAKKA